MTDEDARIMAELLKDTVLVVIPVTFTVPGLPPTANARLYVGDDGHTHTRRGVKSWQDTVAAYGRIAMGRSPVITEPVVVVITYFCGPKRRRDVDAGGKDTLDGLAGRAARGKRSARSGTVIANDKQVKALLQVVEPCGAKDEATRVVVMPCGDDWRDSLVRATARIR